MFKFLNRLFKPQEQQKLDKIEEKVKTSLSSDLNHEKLAEDFLLKVAQKVLREKTITEKELKKKSNLFLSGIKNGSIYFNQQKMPGIQMQDWFVDLHIKPIKEHTKTEKKKMLKTIKERQACINLFYELYGYFEHERQEKGLNF